MNTNNFLEEDNKQTITIYSERTKGYKTVIEDIDKINSELNLNLCFDTTHALQSDIDIDKFWEKFKSIIKAVHLSDFKDGNAHKEIGTGVLKKHKCYNEIINSNKLLILEVGKDFKKAKTKQDAIKIWKNSLQQVISK